MSVVSKTHPKCGISLVIPKAYNSYNIVSSFSSLFNINITPTYNTMVIIDYNIILLFREPSRRYTDYFPHPMICVMNYFFQHFRRFIKFLMDKMYSLKDLLRNENDMKIIPTLGTFDLKYKVPSPPKRLVYLLLPTWRTNNIIDIVYLGVTNKDFINYLYTYT